MTDTPLQALIPINPPVLTTTAHPTVFFYVPYRADQVQFGEFSILKWSREQERVYRVRFTLPATPGVVSVSLPMLPDVSLLEGQDYRWYFRLYCRDGDGRIPDLTVNGSMRRVALTPEREQLIQQAAPELWYDAIALIVNRLASNPTDVQARRDWERLLQTIDAEALSQAAIAGSVIPIRDP